jgi:tetratricopeptide (TPR) repeat protein
MAVRETPVAKINRLLQAGDNVGALQAANEFLKVSPGSFLARLGRARANMRTGNYVEAESDIALALKSSPNDEDARLVRANLDLRLGKTDECLSHLRYVAGLRGPNAVEASISVRLTLHNAGRYEEFVREAAEPGAWRQDPRAELIFARVAVIEDKERGIEELKKVFRSKHHWALRRFGGFEAVGHLDKLKRYREAYDLATEVHRETTAPLEMETWIEPLEQQLKLLDRTPCWYPPRAEPVQGVAFIAAMPRSGTTLLEQMLDRHPAIGGIGEFDGLDYVCRRLFDTGPWPRMPSALPKQMFGDLQQFYLRGANQIRKEGATWTFDKTLRGWRALPEIATCFPGAVCINVERDPRDMATSIFLSYFNPTSYEWTSNFAAIRRIAEYQRRVVPRAFEVLGLANERIVYEDLVEDPAKYAEQCLNRMGLPMDERVLSPEENKKGAFTLSHAQVRQKINKGSIGRWKNYEWAFDGAWDEIVAAHEARRQYR